METLLKTPVAEATREKAPCPPPAAPAAPASRVVSDSLSLPSYKEYPVHHPFVNTPQTRVRQSRPSISPSKGLPETNSEAILSALRSLQEKIRILELEKERAELSMHNMESDVSQTHLYRDRLTHILSDDPTERERSRQTNCNPALISSLAAAETRCVKLERQLEHMKKMLLSVRADRHSMLKEQASFEVAKSGDKRANTVAHHAPLEKLNRLEREYLLLTRTQNKAEMKIQELEMKLQEEEHQRKLLQDKANQLQTGLEANRILLQSVSPSRTDRQPVEEVKSPPKKPSPQPSSHTESHYRLTIRDVPFVAGKSVSCSHSVRANIQSVLSLLKQYQPNLCNSHVHHSNDQETGGLRHSDTSTTPIIGEDLSELLQALQEELRLMSLEQDELARQLEDSVSDEERRELQREQERLLLKMERKGEQIHKLHKHRKQLSKLKKETNQKRPGDGNETSATATTRSRSAKPGEISRRNLRLLRDMKALQTSLQT